MRKPRVIELLRKHYPGKWTFEYPCFWKSDRTEGVREVTAFSRYSPKWDGDDDSFTTEYNDQDGNLILICPPFITLVK